MIPPTFVTEQDLGIDLNLFMLDAHTRLAPDALAPDVRKCLPSNNFLCLPPKAVASPCRNVLAYGLWYSCGDETAHLTESFI